MKLYLDTEFTDLVPGNRLISIALVDEKENYFYAELTDNYSLSHCSDFVKENVLPYLWGGSFSMTFNECALKIGAWIENYDEECILSMDNVSWDLPHLSDLLQPIWPKNLAKKVYHHIYVPDDLASQLYRENQFQVHNALHDALVMCKADQLLV